MGANFITNCQRCVDPELDYDQVTNRNTERNNNNNNNIEYSDGNGFETTKPEQVDNNNNEAPTTTTKFEATAKTKTKFEDLQLDEIQQNSTLHEFETSVTEHRVNTMLNDDTMTHEEIEKHITEQYAHESDYDDGHHSSHSGSLEHHEKLEIERLKAKTPTPNKKNLIREGTDHSGYGAVDMEKRQEEMTKQLQSMSGDGDRNNNNYSHGMHGTMGSNEYQTQLDSGTPMEARKSLLRLRSLQNWDHDDLEQQKDEMQKQMIHLAQAQIAKRNSPTNPNSNTELQAFQTV